MTLKESRTLEIQINKSYENLANAIILQAVSDYVMASQNDDKDPQLLILFGKYDDPETNSRKKEIIHFFNSEWFQELNSTPYSGMQLVDLARKYNYCRYARKKPSFLKYYGRKKDWTK